ncbi:sensor histidine kinase [Pseudoalteromonas luteoviolacea]|nr:hypothetical protein [Pseudoalteromonas luteoviolacea]
MLKSRIIASALILQSGMCQALNFEHLNGVAQDQNNYMYFSSHEGVLKYDGEHIVKLNEVTALPAGSARDLEISESNIAYVLYSSGQIWSLDLNTYEANLFAETDAHNIEVTHDALFTQEDYQVLEYDLATGQYGARISGQERLIDLESKYDNVYGLTEKGLYQINNGRSYKVIDQEIKNGDLEVTPHGAIFFADDHLKYYSQLQDSSITNYNVKRADNLTYVAPYVVYYTDGDEVNEVSLSTLEVARTKINSSRKTYLSLFADNNQKLWGLNINEFGIVEGNTRITNLGFGSKYNIIERVGKDWWIGTTKGVYVNGKPIEWLNVEIGEGKDFEVTAFSHFAGKVIVSTDVGAFAVDTERRSVDKLYGGYVINSSVIAEFLYLATDEEAVVKFNSKLKYEEFNNNSMLSSHEILGVTEIGGELYISTAAGLDRIDSPRSVYREYQGTSKVADVAILDGVLFMATYGEGLLKKVDGNWVKVPSPEYIKEIVEVRDVLYLLTNNGIHTIAKDQDSSRLIRETKDHSFMIGSVRVADNVVIAVSDSAFIEMTNFKEQSIAPPVVSYVSTNEGFVLNKDALEINQKDWVNIAITNLQYQHNEGVKYEYRLNEGSWVKLLSPMIQLNSLFPEHYEVQFRQVVGNVASEPTSYVFEVRSHWYNSPTAMVVYIVIALILATAIALFIYFWVQSFRRVFRQNEQKRQSSNLGQIAMLVEQGKALVSSGDDTMFTEGLVKFDKVSELITPIVNSGPYLGEQRLLAGLDLLQVQSSLQAKIKVNFETVIGNVKLDPQLERDIYAVVYHGLHNSVHHSEGSEVNVFVHKLRSKIHVNIEDDGIGIPLRSRLHFGEGLYKMSDVAKSYKTKFKLKSSRNGTKIQIVFPLIERDRKSKEDIEREIRERM